MCREGWAMLLCRQERMITTTTEGGTVMERERSAIL